MVPQSMQNDMLRKIYANHFGEESNIRMAHEVPFCQECEISSKTCVVRVVLEPRMATLHHKNRRNPYQYQQDLDR